MEQLELEFDIKKKRNFTLADVESNKDIPINITFIDKQKDLKDAINWLIHDYPRIGLDIETTGLDPHTSKVVMFQFGDLDRQFVIDTRTVNISPILPYIINKNTTVVGHNLKFEYKFIKKHYNKPLLKCRDTMLQDIVLYNGYGLTNTLKEVSKRHLGTDLKKDLGKSFLDIEDKPFSKDQIIYGAYDVILPLLIDDKQRPKIKERNMEYVVDKVENEYLKVLGDMELRGMEFDSIAWTNLYKDNLKEFEKKKELLDKFVLSRPELHPFVEKQFDLFSQEPKCSIQWTSSAQVINLLLYLEICPKEVSKTTKKLSYTVDAKVLKTSLITTNKNIKEEYKTFIKDYLKMKEFEQRVTTFGISFLEYINPVTKRIHSDFRQIVSTGRSSSKEPNLQNIPKDPRFRNCFIAAKGNKIINADFTGQETIVLANFSKDPRLIEYYESGQSDMHSFIASKIFKELEGLSVDEIKNNHADKRQIAKSASFAINYGGDGYTIAKNLGISAEEGRYVYDEYFRAFPGLDKYFKDTISKTLKLGYILINETTGRRLYFKYYKQMLSLEKKPERRSEYRKLKGSMSRLALNAPIQGTSADITKLSGIKFREFIYNNKLDNIVFSTNVIHDELNIEASAEYSEFTKDNLLKCMKEAGAIWCTTVPLNASVKISDHWGH